MLSLLTLIGQIIQIYLWIIIASSVLSWLVAFDIVNLRNRYVYLIGDAISRVTEPAYRRIRMFLPQMGGLDLAPLVLLLAFIFLRNIMWEVFGPTAMGCY